MTYSSPTDALRHVLAEGGRVTKSPSNVIRYPEGPYYFVEVTSRTGTVYVLDVFGSEALDLELAVNTKMDN